MSHEIFYDPNWPEWLTHPKFEDKSYPLPVYLPWTDEWMVWKNNDEYILVSGPTYNEKKPYKTKYEK